MNKFILGSILAAISLLAIYGTSASNRVASWVDGSDRDSERALDDGESTVVALNPDGTATAEPIIDVSGRTPLQKAGDIPQRQTTDVQSSPNFGQAQPADGTDDTGGEVVTPNPAPTTPAESPTAQEPPAQTTPEAPIRALW